MPASPADPTLEDILGLLTFLEKNYGRIATRSNTLEKHNLALLRALEVDGLVRVIRVLRELDWVTTPAGAIWNFTAKHAAEADAWLDLDRDILTASRFAWMPRSDALEAVTVLNGRGFLARNMPRVGLDFGWKIQLGPHLPGQKLPNFK